MRTTTTAENTALAALTRSTFCRVFVDSTGAGVFVDLTSYSSQDWVVSVSVEENIDTPSTSCSVVLHRGSGATSLSPLMAAGGPLALRRAIYVEVAVLAYNASPVSGDWRELFRGDIDEIAFIEPDQIELRCSDLYGRLVRTMIEARVQYGSEAGTDVEDVIQQLLDITLGSGAVTLYSENGTVATPFAAADSPGFAIRYYFQEEVTVAEALDALVRQFGWVLRYRWNADADAFVLTLWEPERAASTAARTFGASDYYSISQLSLSAVGIRNRVAVQYTDASTGLRKQALAADATSIAAYGPLYMRISEDEASQIDSSAEASAFAGSILADLKDPPLTHEAEHDLFWPVELGDLVKYTANGVHYDTDQTLAVASIRHTISGGNGRTILGVRGSPSGGFLRWLRLDENNHSRIGDGSVLVEQIDRETGGAYNVVPNGELILQSRSVDLSPPDGWTLSGATYGSGAGDDYWYSTTSRTGVKSLLIRNGGGSDAFLLSRDFPVTALGFYELGVLSQATITGTISTWLATVRVAWLDASRAVISYTEILVAPASANTWAFDTTTETAPSTARYARIEIFKRDGASTFTALVDRIVLQHIPFP